MGWHTARLPRRYNGADPIGLYQIWSSTEKKVEVRAYF